MTDDAPRPALDAEALAEGRRLLAAAAPAPWDATRDRGGEWTMNSDYGLGTDGRCCLGTFWLAGEHDARAVAWLRNHADALLSAAERLQRATDERCTYRVCVDEECERHAFLDDWKWLKGRVTALEAALDALLAAAARAQRLEAAIRMALNGPSDAEIGMETTHGRLTRQERILHAALASQEGDDNGE